MKVLLKRKAAKKKRPVRLVIQVKRWLAMTMAAIMLTMTPMPGLDMVSFADTTSELQPDTTMKENSAGLTTAYKWTKVGTDRTGGLAGRRSFDVEGIKLVENINKDGGYTGSRVDGVISTYDHMGYVTVVRSGGIRHYVDIAVNGGVQTFADFGIDVQMKVYPSPDRKWIFADYIVYNRTGDNKTIDIGSGSDVQVGGISGRGGYDDPADSSKIVADEVGFHMVNTDLRFGSSIIKGTLETFDLRYEDNSLGLTPPTTRWVGHNAWFYPQGGYENYFTNGPYSVSGLDSALTYSWNIPLHPYETVLRRVAFSAKGPSYYVSSSHGDDGNIGTNDSPLATIDKAIEKIGNKKGYICIQDYAPIADTVTVLPNVDITFLSADYNRDNAPISDIVTLIRAAGFNGPLFHISGGNLNLGNLVLDGERREGSEPLLTADAGKLGLQSGLVLQNNYLTAGRSTVEITGSASLEMFSSTITGNRAKKDEKDRVGAGVNFNSSGTFTVRNNVIIKDNTWYYGGPNNVFLSEGKHILVEGDLDKAFIGVFTADIPVPTVAGMNNNQPDQEVLVAAPAKGYAYSGFCPFVNNFHLDYTSFVGEPYYMAEGGKYEGLPDNERNAVFKWKGHQITFNRMAKGSNIPVPHPTAPMVFGVGEVIDFNISKTDSEEAGISSKYILRNIVSNPVTIGTFFKEIDPESPYLGRYRGGMPDEDVEMTYYYDVGKTEISFEPNKGLPKPSPVYGDVGDLNTNSLPVVSRYGYDFLGWSKNNDRLHTDMVTDFSDDWTEFPQEDMKLYAIFKPMDGMELDYTTQYINQDGSMSFQPNIREKHKVEDLITASYQDIHGYIFDRGETLPSTYDYGFPIPDSEDPVIVGDRLEPVGRFDENHDFRGYMPGRSATVRYMYQVDYGNLSARSKLTVRHVVEGESEFHAAADEIRRFYPEESITAEPLSKYGYECIEGKIDSGTKDSPAPEHSSGPITGVTGIFHPNYEFAGTMPNQDVVITYTYKVVGGFPLNLRYLDNGARDPKLKRLAVSRVEMKPANDVVHEAYEEPYGYVLDTKEMTPTGGSINWSAGGGRDVYGLMPSDEVTVTYKHNRDPGKWTDVSFIYTPQSHGKLIRGEKAAEDLAVIDAGGFQASILSDDGMSRGHESAYTIKQLRDEGLSPEPVADDNYMFAGWFIDGNGNGLWDERGGETLYAPDDLRRINGGMATPLTLTAYFKKDPAMWGDITLKAGDNGGLLLDAALTDSVTRNVSKGQTWSGIAGGLPQTQAEVNYIPKGWYLGNGLVRPDDILQWGKTYTMEFQKNPRIFGIDAAVPEILAGLDGEGRGEMRVYDGMAGYQYILADSAGKTLAVQNGNLVGRVVFLDLQPGSRYRVYEAPSSSHVTLGGQALEIEGVSPPGVALVPVVDDNYRVNYDDGEDGKTLLTIWPADEKSQYALLDAYGNVVPASQTGEGGWQAPIENTKSVSFLGLDYNGRYTVVARPIGSVIAAGDKVLDGSVVTTDPGGELEMPAFVIETHDSHDGGGHKGIIQKIVRETQDGDVTVFGSEDTTRFVQARRGDHVYLKAEDGADEGQIFDYWEFTIGSVKDRGKTLKSKMVDFYMPDANLVMTAVYHLNRTGSAATPSNARVRDEVRGGNKDELALVRSEIPELEAKLTTREDRKLSDVNKAKVEYRVVYERTGVKASDSNAIKEAKAEYQEHSASYKCTFGLNVSLERYVDGRKVNAASPSNAAFKTYVQLGRDDVDMLDYQLYDVTPGFGDEPQPVDWVSDEDYDPQITGGLFAFWAEAGHRYVLAYSRAYRMRFVNEILGDGFTEIFRVRRDESPNNGYYDEAYDRIRQYDPPVGFMSDNGLFFKRLGWSWRKDGLNPFDPDQGIKRNTTVYMHYKDDAAEVETSRKEMENYISKLLVTSDDHFLKPAESLELKEFIETALRVLDMRVPRRATRAELDAALIGLREDAASYDVTLNLRYGDYSKKLEYGNKGGSRGGGGGGGGTHGNPYHDAAPKSHQIGGNGKWKERKSLAGRTAQSTFVLNGGIPLKGTWARLNTPVTQMTADGEEEPANSLGWYHFNDHGVMEAGWIWDQGGAWYYCDAKEGRDYGRMVTGWKQEAEDGNWYYLDPVSGAMEIGWRQIEGKWYYLNPVGGGVYVYDSTKERWVYGGGESRPLGAMYKNEVTPDGYGVGADGAWIQ